MLQSSKKLAGVLLAAKLLVMPSLAMAAAPAPVTPSTTTETATPQGEPPTLPNQPDIPKALAPYLDPSIHPDLRFEPDPISTKTDAEALRLEIRLSRRQVTLYRGTTAVKNYAIAVGRPGWETPTGVYEVKQMIKNPTWVNPLRKGAVIPGGDPENPLGRYWIGFWTDGKNWIGFHGTPNPRSVGRAASHGCIRMYNKDVEDLFKQVTLGTVVTVVK
jgi:lipoprotein-anchoring transpeptidase ErfK/SrfK